MGRKDTRTQAAVRNNGHPTWHCK